MRLRTVLDRRNEHGCARIGAVVVPSVRLVEPAAAGHQRVCDVVGANVLDVAETQFLSAVPLPNVGHAISDAQVAAFTPLLLTRAIPSLLHTITVFEAQGLGRENILLDLLGPAAHHLGALWLEDRLTFLDVTLGCSVLQALLRRLAPGFEAVTPPTGGKSIMLAPMPGEQHTLGLSVLAAFFRRAGWSVAFEPSASEDALVARVAAGRFHAVGLSADHLRSTERIPSLVARLRRERPKEGLVILAGGAAFHAEGRDFTGAGLDGIAEDAPEAVRLAESLTGQAAWR